MYRRVAFVTSRMRRHGLSHSHNGTFLLAVCLRLHCRCVWLCLNLVENWPALRSALSDTRCVYQGLEVKHQNFVKEYSSSQKGCRHFSYTLSKRFLIWTVAEMSVRNWAMKCRFIFPPHLTNISTLRGKTQKQGIAVAAFLRYPRITPFQHYNQWLLDFLFRFCWLSVQFTLLRYSLHQFT